MKTTFIETIITYHNEIRKKRYKNYLKQKVAVEKRKR